MTNKKPTDWNCIACCHLNFSRRDSCQRCGQLRQGDGGRAGACHPEVRPGDWYCCSCGAQNFANRFNCYGCNVTTKADTVGVTDGEVSQTSGAAANRWKAGDWLCTRYGCSEHNFANRTECYRCSSPRAYGSGV